MKEKTFKNIIKSFGYTTILVLGIVFLIQKVIPQKPVTPNLLLSVSSTTISIIAVLSTIYVKWLWKYKYLNFAKIPVLKSKYTGKIRYNHNLGNGEKEVTVTIKQTLLSVSVHLSTEINRSSTISSEIIEDHDSKYLIYTYLTNPNATVNQENPMQYGTAKLCIDDLLTIKGNYWTDRQTIGEIELNASR